MASWNAKLSCAARTALPALTPHIVGARGPWGCAPGRASKSSFLVRTLVQVRQETRCRLQVQLSQVVVCSMHLAIPAGSCWRAGRSLSSGTAEEGMSNIHIHVDVLTTPNENAIKLMPGCEVTGQVRSVSIRPSDLVVRRNDMEDNSLERLARQLIGITGVTGLLFGYDFITVEKESKVDWERIEGAAVAHVESHARRAVRDGVPMAPLIGEHARLRSLLPVLEKDGEVVERIIELLEEKVIPNVQADGGDVVFRGFADGVVWLSLVGACASCSSSTMTVRFMIRNLLTHYIDEVTDVRSVGEDDEVALDLAESPATGSPSAACPPAEVLPQ